MLRYIHMNTIIFFGLGITIRAMNFSFTSPTDELQKGDESHCSNCSIRERGSDYLNY